MLKDLKIIDFLDELNSSAPTPGGGGIAALNGAEAAGLVQMVGNVTVNKLLKKDLPPDKELIKCVLIAANLQNDLLGLMDADAEVFASLMECYKLPNTTEEEKTARKFAIQQGCKNACQPPKKTVACCLQLLDLIKIIVNKGDKGVISDGYIAGRLAVCALWGGIYNLKINANAIKDDEFVQMLNTIIANAQNRIESFTRDVLDTCTL